ncbi:hypothetical protein EIP86_009227 [Pleurotus ostreatoroseus]|nr:hypothetical protein EIP86_009227 [Pleurotus ostreatoroseus]
MTFVSVKPIATPLTQLLDVDVPVVCAPLAKAANATLAIHASLGGGFGFIPTGYDGVVGIRRELTAVKTAIEARGLPLPYHLPVGVNLLGWKLEEAGAELKAVLDTALEHHVQAIWLGFGKGLRHFISHIRQHDLACGQKTLVFIGVNTVPEALVATNEFKADVIVAQGTSLDPDAILIFS